MSTETKTSAAAVAETAAEAAALEDAVKSMPDVDTYTHTLKHPLMLQGCVIDELHFDWSILTGADHLAIENELLMRGKTLVSPAFTGDFLCGMAVRACTDRNPDGFRVLTSNDMKAMPMRDFQKICKKASAFLLHAGS